MKYTVDGAIESVGFGPAQCLYISASCTIFYLELLCLVSDGILLPLVKCDFGLNSFEASLYLLVTKLAFCLGGLLGGKLGDRLGRRYSILYGLIFQAIMLTTTLHCTSFLPYTLCHGATKIAFGLTMPSAHSFALEVTPSNRRFLVKVFFGFAGCLGASTGAFIGQFYEDYGWRNIQLLIVIPILVEFVLFYNLGNSPRYLCVQGRMGEAEREVRRLFELNSKVVPVEFAIRQESDVKEIPGTYADLFRPQFKGVTLKLMFILAMKGLFLGAVHCSIPYLMGSTGHGHHDAGSHGDHDADHGDDHSDCVLMSKSSYRRLILTFLPDLLIHPAILVLSQLRGRIYSLSTGLCVSSVFMLITSQVAGGSLLFSFTIGVALNTIAATRSVLVLFTSEFFPTTLRGVSIGILWTADNVGGFVAAFLVEYLVREVPRLFIFAAGCATMVSCLVARSLQCETLNQPLVESIGDKRKSGVFIA